jgi:type III pantothenate kinase
VLLAIDVGNTSIEIGVFKGEELLSTWCLSTDIRRSEDEYGLEILGLLNLSGIKNIEGSVLSSVVPPLTKTLKAVLSRHVGEEPLVITPNLKLDIPILVDKPEEVGADRIMNAIAAKELFGTPIVVVDFGTATTFDVVSKGGEYLGGVIAPGIGISCDALWKSAAQLPSIELLPSPPTCIGRNTSSAMRAGILFGFASLADGIIERIREELKDDIKVVATGGFSHLISEHSRHINLVDKALTLKGLRIAYENLCGD